MADLDTRNKRASAVNEGLPWHDNYPLPDGNDADTAEQRAMLLGLYGGIGASGEVPAVDIDHLRIIAIAVCGTMMMRK